MPTTYLLITGKVQGVFYRATARDVAHKLGVKGWIKNTNDGNVEAEIYSDEKKKLDDFINWCKKGPDGAEVNEVFVTHKEEVIYNEFLTIR